MVNNRRTCAFVLRGSTPSVLANAIKAHPQDVLDEEGNVIEAAPPPSKVTIAAAYVISTMLTYNKQHTSVINKATLLRLARWVVGADGASLSVLRVTSSYPVTLQDCALKICCELSCVTSIQEDMHSSGIMQVRNACPLHLLV